MSVAEAALGGRAPDQLLQALAQRQVFDEALELLLQRVLGGRRALRDQALGLGVYACQTELHFFHTLLWHCGIDPYWCISRMG